MNFHEFFERILKVTLQEVEHSPFSWVSFHVESHRICISKCSTGSDNELGDFFKELQISHCVVSIKGGEEFIDLALNLSFLLLSETYCFVVLGVSCPEMAQFANHLL